MKTAGPVDTDIVLLGGGHAHVHVLTAFAMRPMPGVRLTLVTRDLYTPYSGMLPGIIAGLYEPAKAHIDLVRLSAATGIRLVHAEAIGLDRGNKRVLLKNRPPLAYDLVSIDVGITPDLKTIAGAAAHAMAVKPIGLFLSKLNALLESIRTTNDTRRIAVIGGGAGGVELLLSVRTRILAQAAKLGSDLRKFEFALITEGEILQTHNPRVRATFRRIFEQRGIALHERTRAVLIGEDAIEIENRKAIPAGCTLLATGAAAPAWFPATGLELNDGGFIAVRPTLQSLNDPNVFAAGDCASLVETPREKAGVYAVRAGQPLARNLRLRAQSAEPRAWRPQKRHLALISTGERYAVASRGSFKVEGAWLWTLKDWIDRRWMRMYQDVDRMTARVARRALALPVASQTVEEMRCGGCGAKVGPGPLSRALARLGSAQTADDVIVGLTAPDDAAVLTAPKDKHLVQTVDFFRAFIDDPFVFGEIAANHALNDIFAMGGTPRHALATAVVPAGPALKVEEDLYQVLAGARIALDRENVALVGGHSSEGSDLSVGFSVTGEIAADRIVRKGGLRKGDVLILTKPLGTGILFAAAMRAKGSASSIEAALSEMRRSSRCAAETLVAHGATAMTDVSGFGLVGHLGELLTASGATATIDLSALPLYEDAYELARAGMASSLLPENLALAGLIQTAIDAPTRAILFDPQTSGGLLAGVPIDRASGCIMALHDGGATSARVIGKVISGGGASCDVRISLTGAIAEL
jgi:selenide,water dikinase